MLTCKLKLKKRSSINYRSHMQLTLNEMRNLNRLLDSNYNKYVEDLNIELILKKVNTSILKLAKHKIFEHVTLNHIIQLGTLLRRGDEFCRRTSLSFLFSLINMADEKNSNYDAFCQIQLRFLLFETLKKLSENENFIKLGSNLVWEDEEQKIDEYLLKCQPVSTEQLNSFLKKFSPELNRLIMSGALTDFLSNINKIRYVADNDKTELGTEAKKVLSYIVEDFDVVPDNLGIFGLADDLQVYNNYITKITDKDNSKKQLEEFLFSDDSTLSLFFERGDKISQYNNLAASSPHINYVISSLKYLIENNKKRILAILPDNNLLALIFILNLITINKKNRNINSEIKNINVGDTIYFNLKTKSIAVKYLGEHQNVPGLIKVCDIEQNHTNFNSSLTMPKFAKDLCTLKPKSKKIITDASLIMEWQQTKIDFVPQHIIFSNLDKKIFYLTRKNKFENYNKHLKPFGQKVSNFINFLYKSQNRNDETDFENNLPEVYIFNDAEYLVETLEDIVQSKPIGHSNCIVVSDEPVLMRNFIDMFSDGFGNDHVDLVFLSSMEENILNDMLLKRNFQPIHYPSYISSFSKVDHRVNYNDELSNLEEKFYKSTKKINVTHRNIECKIFEEFIKNYIQTLRDHNQSDNNVTLKLIFKLIQVKNELFMRWLPPTETEKQENSQLLEDTKRLLTLEMGDNLNLKFLHNLLSNNEIEILNLYKSRGVPQFLNFNNDEKFSILVGNKKSSIYLNKRLEELNIFNAKVIAFQDLKGQYLSEKLIIPHQLGKKINRYLSQNNTADDILFFLFKSENRDYEYQSKKSFKEINRYKKLTKNSFNQTSASSLIKEVQNIPEEKTNPLQISEYENNILENLVPNAKSYNTAEVVDATPFFLDNKSKFILITPNSTVFAVTEDEKNKKVFGSKNASQLEEGEKICLPLDSKADMFEELAKSFSPEYSSIKNKATIWKKELRILNKNAFNGNLIELTEFLKNNGIKREFATVKNWLLDEVMIAPLKYAEVLEKMKNLPVRERFKKEIKQNISFIEKCYKMRRETSQKILDIMNKSSNVTEQGDTLKIMFRDASLQLAVHEISAITEIKKVQVDQLWQVNDI